MKLSMALSNTMEIGINNGKTTTLADLCGLNMGDLGSIATGFQGSPDQTSFLPYKILDGLAYIGKSAAEPSTFYTGFYRAGPLLVPPKSIVSGSLTWNTNMLQLTAAFKVFKFRIYAVKNPRAAQLSLTNLPTNQVLTNASVLVDTATWAGANALGNWIPGQQVIDVSPLLTELAASRCFLPINFVQFVFVPVEYPVGNAFMTFGGLLPLNWIGFNYSVV